MANMPSTNPASSTDSVNDEDDDNRSIASSLSFTVSPPPDSGAGPDIRRSNSSASSGPIQGLAARLASFRSAGKRPSSMADSSDSDSDSDSDVDVQHIDSTTEDTDDTDEDEEQGSGSHVRVMKAPVLDKQPARAAPPVLTHVRHDSLAVSASPFLSLSPPSDISPASAPEFKAGRHMRAHTLDVHDLQKPKVPLTPRMNTVTTRARHPTASSRPRMRRLKTRTSTHVKAGVDHIGRRFINQYILLKRLGHGQFGKVKLVQDQNDNQFYAMKILNKKALKRRVAYPGAKMGTQSDEWQNVMREIAIMKKLDHEHIVRLYEVIDDSQNDKLYMVMELMDKGPVMKAEIKTDPLPYGKAWSYFRDLIDGLEYLHAQHVVHRDLKPENLLINKDDQLKIADFGVSFHWSVSDRVKATCGTAAFQPPEMVSEDEKEYSAQAADVWSAGVTLFMFVYGRCPFIAASISGIYEKIVNDPLKFPSHIDDDLEDLLNGMLQKDFTKRYTMAQIKEHPWVTKKGTEPMAEQVFDVVETTEKDVQNAFVVLTRMRFQFRRVIARIRAKLRARSSLSAGVAHRSNTLTLPAGGGKSTTSASQQSPVTPRRGSEADISTAVTPRRDPTPQVADDAASSMSKLRLSESSPFIGGQNVLGTSYDSESDNEDETKS